MLKLPLRRFLRSRGGLTTCVGALLCAAPASANPPPSLQSPDRVWSKTFYDSFGAPLDGVLWKNRQDGFWKDGWNGAGNATTSGGNLRLRMSYDPNALNKNGQRGRFDNGFLATRLPAGAGQPFTDVDGNPTNMTFGQRFGYFEARMKPALVSGSWTAFWLMPASVHGVDNSGRDGCEIDIVETFGFNPGTGPADTRRDTSVNLAIHYDGYGSAHKGRSVRIPMTDIDGRYRTWGLLWTPTCYVWYIDGQEVWRITDPALISQQIQYLKLTTETVLANWTGGDNVSLSDYPRETLVDWVKVWTYDGIESDNFTPPSSGGGSAPPPGGGGLPTFPGTIEAEAMQLQNANVQTVAGLRGISGNGAIGRAEYTGASGNRTIRVKVVDRNGWGRVKLWVNGQQRATWDLNGEGDTKKFLQWSGRFDRNDVVELRLLGTAFADKIFF